VNPTLFRVAFYHSIRISPDLATNPETSTAAVNIYGHGGKIPMIENVVLKILSA
jgi:hypothetical protein